MEIFSRINEFMSTYWVVSNLIIAIIMLLWKFFSERSLKADIKRHAARLDKVEKSPSSINITNIVGGNPKEAKFTGNFYIGYTYTYKNKHETIFIPEIYIEYDNGKKELLNIDGFKFPEGSGATAFISDVKVTLGKPSL